MPDRGHHCPFLNRTDYRCAENLSLDALGYAFDYCFGYYEGCAVYLELLAERRVRRSLGRLSGGGVAEEIGDENPGDRIIPLTIAGREYQRTADTPLLSHASGV